MKKGEIKNILSLHGNLEIVMLIKLHKISGILVAILLIALSGVFVCDNLCDFDIAHVGHFHSPDHQFAVSKPDSHSHYINTVNKHKHESGHGSQHQDIPDNCCENETHPLFSTLIKKKIEFFDLKVKITGIHWDFVHDLTQLTSYTYRIAGKCFVHAPPPLQGRYLRVQLCSFLN